MRLYTIPSMWRPSRTNLLLFLVLVALGLGTGTYLYRLGKQPLEEGPGYASPEEIEAIAAKDEKNISATRPPLKDFLAKESVRIGQIDEDPDATERRLKTYAGGISLPEAKQLAALAVDRKREGDERFLAAYLLSHGGTSSVREALRALARSPMPEVVGERERDLERGIRALAIEGLARDPDRAQADKFLAEAGRAVQDTFLADTAERARQGVKKGDVDAVETQQKEALQQVLER